MSKNTLCICNAVLKLTYTLLIYFSV